MRKTELNGIKIEYPDITGFVFNKSYVHAESETVSISSATVTIGDFGVKFNAYGKSVTGDYSDLVKCLFRDVDYRPTYGDVSKMTTCKSITSVLTVTTTDGEETQFEWTSFYIWGAMKQGEKYNYQNKLVIFQGHPFTAGIYINSPRDIYIVRDGDFSNKITLSLTEQGVYQIDLTVYGAEKTISIIDTNGRANVTTFDETFDYTFGYETMQELIRANIVNDYFEKKAYLRWINRHGNLSYWLFKMCDSETVISSDVFMRNDLNKWANSTGWAGTYGRRQMQSRSEYMTLCAPLISRKDYDFIMDMASSPIVDIWDDINGKWKGVTVIENDYIKDEAEEMSDFVAKIEFEPTLIQRL